ncbi:hypothetical protein LTR53_006700 [Teratosphaeriaceae sp. CCFEE 6253]|nr:hypothetical protein LTR53_006700 [Teratosphaeriaceae sp. CCFEE 6253]
MSFTTIELARPGDLATQDLRDVAVEAPGALIETASSNTVFQAAAVPDGGYGWVVVLACAIIAWWFIGITYSWGVIQAALVEENAWSASTLSLVGSLTVACIAIFAIANAKLITITGARRLGLLGISLLGVGEIVAGSATKNVGAMFATVGVLMGIGTSMCFMTISVLPSQYFLRKRGLANGLVFAGGGLGGAAISLFTDRLLDAVGPAWTLRITGLMTLATGLPAAWLIRERAPSKRTIFVDWSLFKDPRFGLLFLSGVVTTFPLLVPPFFLPLYCNSLGLRPAIGAAAVATFNFSSALGRVGCGLLCDHLGPLNVLTLVLLASGLSMLVLWPFSESLAPLIVFTIWNGVAGGGFFAVMPTVVGSVFGAAKVPIVTGMVVTGWTGGYLMGGPIAGYILEAYRGEEGGTAAYRPAMYYAGSMSVGAAILVAVMRLKIDPRVLRRL